MTSPETFLSEPMRHVENASLNTLRERLGATSGDLCGNGAEDGSPILDVLIVHEDVPAAWRAKRVLDHLQNMLGIKMSFVVKLWAFELLRDPLLHAHAVSDVSDAHILFLSLHGRRELPLAVCDLINHWIAGRAEQHRALVVSLKATLKELAPAQAVLDYLRAKAIAGKVDLFPHFDSTLLSVWNRESEMLPAETDESRQFPEWDPAHATYRRWGLNE